MQAIVNSCLCKEAVKVIYCLHGKNDLTLNVSSIDKYTISRIHSKVEQTQHRALEQLPQMWARDVFGCFPIFVAVLKVFSKKYAL